jgi:hypothetical protein
MAKANICFESHSAYKILKRVQNDIWSLVAKNIFEINVVHGLLIYLAMTIIILSGLVNYAPTVLIFLFLSCGRGWVRTFLSHESFKRITVWVDFDNTFLYGG